MEPLWAQGAPPGSFYVPPVPDCPVLGHGAAGRWQEAGKEVQGEGN